MAYFNTNTANLSLEKLDLAIKELTNKINEEQARKADTEKKMSEKNKKNMGSYTTSYEAKLMATKKHYLDAREKLQKYINHLSEKKVPGTENSYLTAFFEGKESAVTLAQVGIVLKDKDVSALDAEFKTEIASGDLEISPNATVQRTFMDRVKNLTGDIKYGKGKAVGLAKVMLGMGALSFATKGVTSALAKKGVISSSLSLFDLAGMGIERLPSLFSSIVSGATQVFNFSPIGFALVGGFLAIKALPKIRSFFQKTGQNFDKAFNSDKNFAKKYAPAEGVVERD